METIKKLTEEIIPLKKPRFLAREYCQNILYTMYLCRATDEKMKKLVRQNKGGSFQLGIAGHEMIGVVAAKAFLPGVDWAFPYYRDRAFVIGLGAPLVDIIGAFLARDVPHHSGGKMMPEHFSHKELNIPCQSSCVGSQFLQAVGVAKGLKMKNDSGIVYVSGGDGATSQGDFHEALNFSCLHRLPILFLIQDNGYAISVPIQEQTCGGSIAHIAKGYAGLAVFEIDGCDYVAASTVLDRAVSSIRQGKGPALVVAKIPRIAPHSSSDNPQKYKSCQEIAAELQRDPIPLFEKFLLERGDVTLQDLELLREKSFQQVEEASRQAEEIPFPKKSCATNNVFTDYYLAPIAPPRVGEPIVMMDAINHALLEEMEKDPSVVVFGQDVAHGKGGVFGITTGLTKKFGPDRCFNTPLAESTIVGLATGLSFVGYKPVCEIQFADYSWTAMNQLINELASIHYRSNGEWHCPIVIRMPSGGYIQGGPYHSQSIEAFLAHCPGLKVAYPSNAADAKMLLKAAIQDPNPVIFLEHKALYRQRTFAAKPEPLGDALLPFGEANVVREGKDVTIVCWGMMVMMAQDVAIQLEKEGISVEVVDLRTIVPCDIESVLRSTRKTKRLLILHEAPKTGGFGAELIAKVVESGLSIPMIRVAAKDCPVPYCKELEDAVLPQKRDLEMAIRLIAKSHTY